MDQNRDQIIIRTSVIGIVANVFLASFKAVVGLLSHSVAVVMDAVNNLSDALSSLITIVGTKLSQREPDKKHPLGYGRVEYLSATVISVIVLYAGITSLVESIKSIFHPQTPDYSTTALIIIAVAVVVKLLLGSYVKRIGQSVDSDALVASGSDATFDAVISASTLVAAIIYLVSGVSLEAWLGAAISLVIVKSGVEMLGETVSEILGERVDSQLATDVKRTVTSFDQVNGAYDLIIHNYGPEKLVGSVHIEVPDTMSVKQLDQLERDIARQVAIEHGVGMAGISVYSVNTSNDEAARMEQIIREVVFSHPEILQVHGFYVDETRKHVQFDAVIGFEAADRMAVLSQIKAEVKELYPDYTFDIAPDIDYSD